VSLRRAALALAVGVLLLPIGLIVHEVLHLAVLLPLGDTGRLIVRDWAFTFLPLSVPALHAQVDHPLATVPHLVFDFLGPALAAIPFAVLAALTGSRPLRYALLGNAAALGFFALIEPADLLADLSLGTAPQFLLWAEFNLGVPLSIVLLAAVLAGLPPRHQEREPPREAGKAPRPRVFEELHREPGAPES
jgi:hypothetical protein